MAYKEEFDGIDSNNMQYEDDFPQEMTSPSPSQALTLESQLDEQFIVYMLEIDSRYKSMMKQDLKRVE